MLEYIGSQHEFKARILEGKRAHIAITYHPKLFFRTKSYCFITEIEPDDPPKAQIPQHP